MIFNFLIILCAILVAECRDLRCWFNNVQLSDVIRNSCVFYEHSLAYCNAQMKYNWPYEANNLSEFGCSMPKDNDLVDEKIFNSKAKENFEKRPGDTLDCKFNNESVAEFNVVEISCEWREPFEYIFCNGRKKNGKYFNLPNIFNYYCQVPNQSSSSAL